MIYTALLTTPQGPSHRTISGSTLGEIIGYLEGTGLTVVSIQDTNNLVVKDETSDTIFNVSLEDNETSKPQGYSFLDNYASFYSWLTSQQNKQIKFINKQKTSFVRL